MKTFLLICLLFSAISCNNTQQDEQQKQKIKVIQVQPIPKKEERSYSFLSKPYYTTELSFRVGGPVTTLNAQNGQFFKKGELIAAIDERDFIIHKQRAEALFEQAQSDYIRITSLYRQGNISGSCYEKAKADYKRAKADLNTAINDLKDTRLTAPFNGYVQKVNIDKYQDVSPSFPVLTFIDLSKIKVETYIPEDIANQLRYSNRQESSYIQFNVSGNKKYYPIETFVTQNTSENNLSYLFTAILDNGNNELFGGMSGSLSIQLPQTSIGSQPAVAIPQTAVCHNPQTGAYVWLVDNDKRVSKKTVKIGTLMSNNQIEILSGLIPGDKIVTNHLLQLSENEKIEF